MNASLQSAIDSEDTINTLASNVSEIHEEQRTLEEGIAEGEACLNTSQALNEQSAEERDSAVSAVDQLRRQLESLGEVDTSGLEEIRRMIGDVRDELDSADLSGVYATLRGRLEEQRAARQELEARVGSLVSDVEYLRRVNQELPEIPPGCNRKN